MTLQALKGAGLRFWSSDSYKIHMGHNAAEYLYGPVIGYSIKTNMHSTPGRGWTWGIHGQKPIAALNNQGDMQIAGKFVAMKNIGIGVDHPTIPFYIRTSHSIPIWLERTGGTHNNQFSIQISGYTVEGNPMLNNGSLSIRARGRSADIALIPNADSAPQFVFKPTGRLGIGTHEPQDKLVVMSDGTDRSVGLFGAKGTGSAGVMFDASDGAFSGNVHGSLLQGDDLELQLSNHGPNPIKFSTAQQDRMVISGDGNVGIGNIGISPSEKLTVDGTVLATKIKVQADVSSIPDYVFDEGYGLMPLGEVERFVRENKHLPGIQGAERMAEGGVDLGELNLKLLEKIEELTLYLISQNHLIDQLQNKEIKQLREKIEMLEKQIGN